MKEVKEPEQKPSPPKKPLIFYYCLALIVLMLLNALFFPSVLERQVYEVPYSQFLTMVDNPYNGITLCTGSLGVNPMNNLVSMINTCKGRMPFVHLRNIKITGDHCFEESGHLSEKGSLDMYDIIKALYDGGFDGYVRPDHGRMIWGETGRAGYGLYDRALGAMYLQGIIEAVEKNAEKK